MTSSPTVGFTDFVDNLALQLVGHSPTFESFVIAMPGVLPDEALASLHRMTGPQAERLAADAANDRAGSLIDQCAALPLPHPLDSEFRFDDTTAKILARGLIAATRPGDEILLIGVPTVAIELAAIAEDRTIRFLGPDNCVTAAVRDAFANRTILLDQGPGRTAAAALLDPPWYAAPMSELIQICAWGCREGALAKLVMPPIGTRPEIAVDRSAFLNFAAEAGMVQTGTSAPVCYRTPLFELAALERQGIARLPSWRRGEVVEFKVGASAGLRTWQAPQTIEFSFAGVRLRLVSGDPGGGATLVPIAGQEVFPSVSVRAPGRSRATLWTTTNRAFAVDLAAAQAAFSDLALNPELLQARLYAQQNNTLAENHVETSGELIHQLVELVGRELGDARRLVGDGAWLKAEMDWRF